MQLVLALCFAAASAIICHYAAVGKLFGPPMSLLSAASWASALVAVIFAYYAGFMAACGRPTRVDAVTFRSAVVMWEFNWPLHEGQNTTVYLVIMSTDWNGCNYKLVTCPSRLIERRACQGAPGYLRLDRDVGKYYISI